MNTDTKQTEIKAAFAQRFGRVMDAAGAPPKGKGRQDYVAKLFGVANKTAYKWLSGEAIPETWRIIDMARRFGVRCEWLLCGTGPMRAEYDDLPAEVLVLAYHLHRADPEKIRSVLNLFDLADEALPRPARASKPAGALLIERSPVRSGTSEREKSANR